LEGASSKTKRRVVESSKRMLPVFAQHALWRPRARELVGQLMRDTDERRLKEDLDQGVRLAQSLGLDVSDVELPL
jgi:hypothetical protein